MGTLEDLQLLHLQIHAVTVGGVVLVILGDVFSSNCFSGLGWMIF